MERRTSRQPRAVRAWPLVTGALFAAFTLRPLGDADLFWHLALGRAAFEARSRVVPEPIAIPGFGHTSVVHEWLWDVLLYRVHEGYGYGGLSALVAVTAALAGVALGLLVTRWRAEAPRLSVAVGVTLLAAPLVLTRINERPESAAMVFWPLGLLLARGLSRSSEPRPVAVRAAALVLLAVLWAQVHLSIVAFAAAAAIVLVPAALGPEPTARVRLVVVLLVFATVLTTAPGLLVFTVPSRLSPYITDHVAEWMPLRWAMLDPTDPESAQGPAFAALVVGAVALGWRRRRALAVEHGLVLVALALAWQGRRGLTPAAILCAPLAVSALDAAAGGRSARERALRAAVVVVGVVCSWRMLGWADAQVGRLGRVGLDEGAFPMSAARLLSQVGGEHRALTTYRTGPTLAFETRSRVRAFVDSRTPIFTFDEADLAAARAAWSQPAALPAVTARYAFDVAVVERTFPACAALAASRDWTLVLVEPRFATFARAGTSAAATAAPLRRLQPCGPAYLDDASCAAPLADLDREVELVGAASSAAFGRYLRADRLLRCAARSERLDGDAIAALLPSAADASGFRPARDQLEAWLLALAGRPREAIALLAPHALHGDEWVLREPLPALARGGADAELRRMLERLVVDARDAADPTWVVALANACARLGDTRCARLRAVEAAALGRADVAPALCFVRLRPEQRDEADGWLQTLRASAPPAGGPSLACPR